MRNILLAYSLFCSLPILFVNKNITLTTSFSYNAYDLMNMIIAADPKLWKHSILWCIKSVVKWQQGCDEVECCRRKVAVWYGGLVCEQIQACLWLLMPRQACFDIIFWFVVANVECMWHQNQHMELRAWWKRKCLVIRICLAHIPAGCFFNPNYVQ